MPSLTAKPSTPATPSGYCALSSGLLQLSEKALASYYCLPDSGTTPQLLCSRGATPSADAMARLREQGYGRVLITEKEFPALSERLVGKTGAILTDTRLSQAERFSMLLAARSNEAETVQRLLKPIRLVGLAKQAAEDIFELLHAGRVAPAELFHAPRFGSRWLIHGANVACYSVLLGIATGIQDQEDLRRLAIAAMLHDLGQRCDGDKEYAKLTREEKQDAHDSHPQRGFEELLGDSDLDRRQLMVVYQHHESLDGGGFPVGVLQDEIAPWAMMVRVVDEFDELTTVEPGRAKPNPETAFRKLRERAGKDLNTEMLRCWMQVMSKA
ncbi:Cyclic di-GMP phosphodiesterase response regulator RpfG [Posidoniimonas polymericola]|uniref:Cyclic di-GMP phosphodiesterase response regulator RpfG n=1 Tax=Posidoniimonas polymericola TaxID=2528002 RepID=A0A5C5XQA4_9BACT|nr:HD domain-containing phosphohydrolase [Posidoniimonas polymericola]TWT65406.1 Cyclic di-GMP phosphodiesterase response regulator RpfG [Posidoniimonas polymericola]